jgi:hypothetical protein
MIGKSRSKFHTTIEKMQRNKKYEQWYRSAPSLTLVVDGPPDEAMNMIVLVRPAGINSDRDACTVIA